MSGYLFAMGNCGSCNKLFSFNPDLVPAANGAPICKECVEWANPIRAERGLATFKVLAGAYEPKECD
jgi:hypothetical protein